MVFYEELVNAYVVYRWYCIICIN